MTYRQFFLACSSSVVQYFNYAIFSFSALELASKLMPGVEEKHKLLNFFTAIILTVIARPLGSAIFGQIGDKIGRKFSIIFAGIISSIGVFFIPFIPSYSTAGLYASFFLILCRMLFLSGLTGEIDGVRLYISENMSTKKQNFGNGLVTLFTQSGALTASITLHVLVDEGWKYCFFIGGVAGVILSLLRLYIPETHEYAKIKDRPSQYYNVSFMQILYGQTPLLLRCVILFGSIGCMYQFFIIFLPIYTKVELGLLNIREFIPLYITLYGICGASLGYIADKVGNYNIIKTSLLFIILAILALFYAIEFKKIEYIPYIIAFASIFLPGFSVPTQMLLKQRINIGIRYRIFSLGHSLGSLFLSAPTSYICAKLAIESDIIAYSLLYPAMIILLSLLTLKSLIAKAF